LLESDLWVIPIQTSWASYLASKVHQIEVSRVSVEVCVAADFAFSWILRTLFPRDLIAAEIWVRFISIEAVSTSITDLEHPANAWICCLSLNSSPSGAQTVAAAALRWTPCQMRVLWVKVLAIQRCCVELEIPKVAWRGI
jgi:hypothetical protein